MNDSFILRQAKFFSERVRQEAGTESTVQVELAYRLTLGRAPTKLEADRSATLIKEHGLENLCLGAAELQRISLCTIRVRSASASKLANLPGAVHEVSGWQPLDAVRGSWESK